MAAPSGIQWGAIAGDYGRIALYFTPYMTTNTTISIEVQVWVWTKYSVSDTKNSLYLNAGTSYPTTHRGAVNIQTHTNSGEWSTSNQQLIYTYNAGGYTKTTSPQTISFTAALTGVEMVGAGNVMYTEASYTIPALQAYTISYNANGKTLTNSLPSSHTKYYNISTTVSSKIPTTTGYTCAGWMTAPPESKFYAFGATYTANASAILYACWNANTYKVVYDANGGLSAPLEQTKTYGVALTLRSEIPVRPRYRFLGWSPSSTATSKMYDPGGSYTANSAVRLYAVWELAYVEPTVNNVVVERCDMNGVADDEGTYLSASFGWSVDPKVVPWDITLDHQSTRLNRVIFSRVRYGVNSNNSSPPSSWSVNVVETAAGQYLWMNADMANDNGEEYSAIHVLPHGAGNSPIKHAVVTYQATDSTDNLTIPTGAWVSSTSLVGGGGRLWTRTVVTYENGTTSTLYFITKRVGTITTYQISTSSDKIPTDKWSRSELATYLEGQYLWKRTMSTYSDGSVSVDHLVFPHGFTGSSITTSGSRYYQLGSSTNKLPAGAWTTAVPKLTSGLYLWMKDTHTFDDGTIVPSYTVDTRSYIDATCTSGTFTIRAVGDGGISSETTGTLAITISDVYEGLAPYSIITTNVLIPATAYPIDILAEGKGVAFGKPAKNPGWLESNFKSRFLNGLYATGLYGHCEAVNDDTIKNTPVIVLPKVNHSCFGTGSNTNEYLKNMLRWICENYPDTTDGIFIGAAHLDYVGTFIVHIYDTNNTGRTSSDEPYLPEFSSGVLFPWSGDTISFSTRDYEFGSSSAKLDAYPVNSIYISYSHTSPASLFGGTWQRISDRFLWGCDSNGSIGGTGGAKTVTLTMAQMPKHNHPIRVDGYGSSNTGVFNYSNLNNGKAGYFGSSTDDGYLQSAGSGAAHENMPPYIQVSIWRRTA